MNFPTVLNTIHMEEQWKYLPIDTILNYCSEDESSSEICNDPNTWKYLLYRDYSINSKTDDPKKEYMKEREFEKNVQDIMNKSISEVTLLIGYHTDFNQNNYGYEYDKFKRNYIISHPDTFDPNSKEYRVANLNFNRKYLIDLIYEELFPQ